MIAYRAGQRVRIEWPDGALFEGEIVSGSGPEYYTERGGITVQNNYLCDGRTVTVLSEPRPDEPTGLGAVVDDRLGTVWVRVDHRGSGFACWREVTPGRYDSDACMREWKHVDAVRILSEGWTP